MFHDAPVKGFGVLEVSVQTDSCNLYLRLLRVCVGGVLFGTGWI